jgi:hypothetical protein
MVFQNILLVKCGSDGLFEKERVCIPQFVYFDVNLYALRTGIWKDSDNLSYRLTS